jgi:membrane protease YdiL (CAAX protease family)
MRHWRPLTGPRSQLQVPEALAVFALSMLLLLSVGPVLVAGLGLGGTAVAQVVLIAGPVIGFTYLREGSAVGVARLLGLRMPTRAALLAALLIGTSFWLLNLSLVVPVAEALFDGDEAMRELERMVLPDGQPLWISLMVVALLPAVCEELLFRGALARAMQTRLTLGGAVLASAILFGLFHVLPVRMLPTAVFGAALAYASLCSGSTITGIIIHLANNAIAILLAAGELAPLAHAITQHPELTGTGAIVMSATGFSILAMNRLQVEVGSS